MTAYDCKMWGELAGWFFCFSVLWIITHVLTVKLVQRLFPFSSTTGAKLEGQKTNNTKDRTQTFEINSEIWMATIRLNPLR